MLLVAFSPLTPPHGHFWSRFCVLYICFGLMFTTPCEEDGRGGAVKSAFPEERTECSHDLFRATELGNRICAETWGFPPTVGLHP